MSPLLLTRELECAKDAALKAGKIIASLYGKSISVSYKSENQPLTEADTRANQIIKELLLGNFPTDGWLSEEDLDDGKRLTQERLWVVDPLDGTKDFIRQNPEFAVSIGLLENGKPILGVVYNPIKKELFWSARDHGTYLGKKKISVKIPRVQEKIHLLVSVSEHRRGEWDFLKDRCQLSPVGGSAYKMAQIAAGKADASFTMNPRSEWDVCAGHNLIEEAGGFVCALDGSTIAYNQKNPLLAGLIYGNSEFYKDSLLSFIPKRP